MTTIPPKTALPPKKHFQWTGFSGKTLWDWLELFGTIAIPIVVVFASIWYSHDLQIAHDQQQQMITLNLDQQQQTTYDTFLDRMSDLITTQKLKDSHTGDEVRILARARTLIALKGLDSVRKGYLILFLSEAHLVTSDVKKTSVLVDIKKINVPVDLSGADLLGAVLHDVKLHGALLSDTLIAGAILYNSDLSDADLHQANLNQTNLKGAHLEGSHLEGAQLEGACLKNVDLSGTDLTGANLTGANLTGAKITQQQVNQANICKGIITSNSITHSQMTCPPTTKTLQVNPCGEG